MKKSPLSTPRGIGGRQGLGWNSGGGVARGYGRPKSYEFYSPNCTHTSQSMSGGEDFIPFDITPPSNQRKSSDNWQSPRGRWQGARGGEKAHRRQSAGPGYTSYRDNRGKDHHQQPPFFKDVGRQLYGPQKNFQRHNTRRKPDISQYVNLPSFLEDPWSELVKKLSNDISAEQSHHDASPDLHFSNAVLGDVSMNESMDERSLTNTDLSCQDITNDSLVESDSSFVNNR